MKILGTAGYFVFRHAGTKVGFYSIAEDKIWRPMYILMPGPRLTSDLRRIAPGPANTPGSGSASVKLDEVSTTYFTPLVINEAS